MSDSEKDDLREYLDKKIDQINDKNTRLVRWFIGIVILVVMGLAGTALSNTVVSRQNIKNIEILTNQVKISVDWVTWFRVNQTYEMEFRALSALSRGDQAQFNEIIEEFRKFRWELAGDKVEQQKKMDNVRRGGSYQGGASME